VADGLSVILRQDGPIPLDVDLKVAPGQTLALVGPSGAGKTTVLRAIAGLYRPAQGRIRCHNDIWLDTAIGLHRPARQRRAGFVFQSYALFPHLTVVQNIMEAMLDLPPPAREAAARALVAQVHLDGLDDRRPDALSGGQQQRVALARALARTPEVLLLDEPFSAVDPPTRRALHQLLSELRATTPMPIILVSHDIEDAARAADQLCYITAGCTVEQGATQALLDKPDSHVSRWLGH